MNQPTLTLKTAPVAIIHDATEGGFIADKLAIIPTHLHTEVAQAYNDRYTATGRSRSPAPQSSHHQPQRWRVCHELMVEVDRKKRLQ
jgi:hypothetical protein